MTTNDAERALVSVPRALIEAAKAQRVALDHLATCGAGGALAALRLLDALLAAPAPAEPYDPAGDICAHCGGEGCRACGGCGDRRWDERSPEWEHGYHFATERWRRLRAKEPAPAAADPDPADVAEVRALDAVAHEADAVAAMLFADDIAQGLTEEQCETIDGLTTALKSWWGLHACSCCNGSGLVAPGDPCGECGGSGRREREDGYDLARALRPARTTAPAAAADAPPMTLDEAIAHATERADATPCGRQHAQLAGWLTELRQLRAPTAADPHDTRRTGMEHAAAIARDMGAPAVSAAILRAADADAEPAAAEGDEAMVDGLQRDAWANLPAGDVDGYHRARLLATLATLRSERDAARSALTEMSAVVERSAALVRSFHQDGDTLDDTVGVVVDALGHTRAALDGANREIVASRSILAGEGRELSDALAENASLRSSLAAMHRRAQAAEGAAQRARASYAVPACCADAARALDAALAEVADARETRDRYARENSAVTRTLMERTEELAAARSALAEVAHQLQPAEGENVVDAATRRAAQALTYADQAKALRSALADAERDYLAVAQAAGIVYQADGHADEPGSVEEIVERIRELQVTETEWMEARYFGFSADGTCRACSGDGYYSGEDPPECLECHGHGVSPRLLAARFLAAGWRRRTHVERARVGRAKELGEAIAAEARDAIDEAKRLRAALSRATERGERMAVAVRDAWGDNDPAVADARDAAGGETESK